MRSLKRATAVIATMILVPCALATNGDNLIGVGPVSRSMGGVGVAAPQDSITAIFDNPAAMSFCPCGVQSEAIFGATIFDPTAKAKITSPMGTLSGTSQHDVFLIPAVGVNMPIGEKMRFGIGAYGISGLGVDYRNMGWDLDGDPSNGYEGDVYTRLEIMKFSPMLSYKVNDELSLGLALPAAYNNLDLGEGGTHDYTFGVQLGASYVHGIWSLGASLASPQKATHERVFNFDAFMGSTTLDTLELESPTAFVFGAAVEPSRQLLVEINAKFYQWSEAAGYKDFDWDDQWVIALGAQYWLNDRWVLRGGFNWGENPVKTHDGWDPMGVSQVQGKSVPTFGYEYLRTIGFPAIVESHLTLGVGYWITESMSLNLGFMHAFEETMSNPSAGNAFVLESSLEENSYSLSLGWEFE